MKQIIDKNHTPAPSEEEVLKYLDKRDNLQDYKEQDNSLKKLFLNTYPKNIELDDILIKVACLNDFYSTNIKNNINNVAKHILELNIDKRLTNGDLSLVNEISKVDVGDGKIINFYSFASKYCYHHKHDIYPIYDSYVKQTLLFFKKWYSFAKFTDEDLKDYEKFEDIINQFIIFFKLGTFNKKQIDTYLWLLGKNKFPNYNKKLD